MGGQVTPEHRQSGGWFHGEAALGRGGKYLVTACKRGRQEEGREGEGTGGGGRSAGGNRTDTIVDESRKELADRVARHQCY